MRRMAAVNRVTFTASEAQQHLNPVLMAGACCCKAVLPQLASLWRPALSQCACVNSWRCLTSKTACPWRTVWHTLGAVSQQATGSQQDSMPSTQQLHTLSVYQLLFRHVLLTQHALDAP